MIDVPVLVKDALRDGRMIKNYRILVLNDDETTDFVIDNNTLVTESVNIDERMCSGDEIKYGLCEGSSLEFQYFNHENIVGRRLQVFIDAQYLAGRIAAIDEDGSFTVPADGTYDLTITEGDATGLLISYASGGEMYVDFVLGQTTDTEDLETGDVVTINGGSDGTRLEIFASDVSYSIPMGFFTVKKCSRQASTGIIKATAYNRLMSQYLDSKANDLLKSMFTYDATVTVMDIESSLLAHYQIEEVQKERIPTFNPFGTVYFDLGEFHLTQNYGIDSFINPCVAPFATNGFGIVLIGSQLTTDLEIGKLDAVIGPLTEISYCYDDWLREVIDGAHLDISYDTLFDRLMTGYYQDVGYGDLLRVERSESGSVSSGSCNDVIYDYQVAHGITPTWHPMQNAWVYGSAYYFIQQVEAIGIYELGTDPTSAAIWIHSNSRCYYNKSAGVSINQYEYYKNAQQQKAVSTAPSIIFKDGTKWSDVPSTWDDSLIGLYDYPDEGINLKEVGKISQLPEFTLRDITTASYETRCQFGKLDRITDLFSGVELNHERLYPADTLYPADNLYPGGGALSGFKSLYSKLWADEGNARKWRNLIITYKGGDGNEHTLQRVVNQDGTDDYNMSDNWIFKNYPWTASQVGEYADAMVTKMQYLIWFPFEMWAAGLPYLETGDEIEIPLNGVTYTSYILRRQLKGIQNLQDTYINGVIDIY